LCDVAGWRPGAAVANTLGGLGVDEYFTARTRQGTLSLLTDAFGSTIALVDKNGAVQTQYSYEPFGTTAATGAASNNTFQEERWNRDYYYYRARYYHSQLKQFSGRHRSGGSGFGVGILTSVAFDVIGGEAAAARRVE
jgi:hypothetical protein